MVDTTDGSVLPTLSGAPANPDPPPTRPRRATRRNPPPPEGALKSSLPTSAPPASPRSHAVTDAATSAPAAGPRPSVLGTIGPGTSTAARPPRTPTHLSREQILDATAACLHDLGYDGTTIRRIAKQLDCAVGSIYRYFDDKRALLAAVVQRRFDPVLQRIERGAPVDAVANFYAQIAVEQPELYRLMFWLSCLGHTTQANTLPLVIQKVIDGWAKQLDDRPAAEAYWNQLHGEIMQGRRDERLTPPSPPSPPPPPSPSPPRLPSHSPSA